MTKSSLIKPFFLFLISFLLSHSAYSQSALSTAPGEAEYQFMIISDLHLGSTTPMELAPTKDDERNDLDKNTFNMLMQHLNATLLATPFDLKNTLVLGDLIDHTTSSATGSVATRTEILHTSFSTLSASENLTHIPFAYVPGNNDSLSGNYKPFYTSNLLPHSAKEIAQSTGWQGFLSTKRSCTLLKTTYPCLLTEDKNGYYVEKLSPNLRLIALNSVLFSSRNGCTQLCQNEIAALKQQLAKAQQEESSVILAGHIPPGTDMYSGSLFWSVEAHRRFFEAVTPYASNIVAFFAGHTHMEELSLLKIKETAPIPVIFTAGFSTSHGNLPSVKFVQLKFDEPSKKWQLKNYQTYRFLDGNFSQYYDGKEVYCKETQTQEPLTNCLASFLYENRLQELQNLINARFTVGNPNYQTQQQQHNPTKLVTLWPESF